MKTKQNFEIKTWIYEAGVAAILLIVSVILNNISFEAVLSAVAVFYSFMHIQISDRLQEQEAMKIHVSVECHDKLNRYLVLKEVLWIMFFILSGAYPALLGCILFISYPLWRKYYRTKIKPLPLPTNMLRTFDTEYYKPLKIRTEAIINPLDMMHLKSDSEALLKRTKAQMTERLIKELEPHIVWKTTKNFDNSIKLSCKIVIAQKQQKD